MTIRVAQIGTGNVGAHALRALITNPDYDLTAVWVSSEAKAGRDAADLVGLDAPTGIKATTDLDEVLATGPDCVVYNAMADNRLMEALADYRKILAAGINAVGSGPVFLQWPWKVIPDEMIQPLEDAAREGDSSLFVNGIDPGFANDLLPLALAGTCQSVEQLRCVEILDYATYDSATVMFDVMGFGKPLDEVPLLFQPGVLSVAWGCAIRQLAAGLNIEIDSISESYQREPAPEDFDIAAGRIRRGGVAAVRFEIIGMSGGRPAIVVEHVTRLRGDLRPDWAQPAQAGGSYRVQITGEPSYTVDICPTSQLGDHNHAAISGAAGRIVNAIPAVIAAPPGIRTTLDLPLTSPVRLFETAALHHGR